MSWLMRIIARLLSPSTSQGSKAEVLQMSPRVESSSTTTSTTVYARPKREVSRVFVHCSASDYKSHDDIQVIAEWHRARGFNGVGYHYFIQADGTLQYGRDLERIPAAQKGHNTGSVAICLHGSSQFTESQFRTLRDLCKDISGAHGGAVSFHGHREVDANKTCPNFEISDILRLNAKHRLV